MVVIGVALIIGIAKGTKAVFQTLIIPDYVSLERLPAAYGMQMVCNGILSITIGPFIGKEIFLILSLVVGRDIKYDFSLPRFGTRLDDELRCCSPFHINLEPFLRCFMVHRRTLAISQRSHERRND